MNEDEYYLNDLDLEFLEENLKNVSSIFDIQETLKELKDIDFNILSNKDKYEIYKELINLYEEWHDDVIDISNYEECDKGYFEIVIDIINNIKYFFSLLQTTKLENIVIELMKPSRVLNRLTTYEDWEPC
jgi:hypothetical protein